MSRSRYTTARFGQSATMNNTSSNKKGNTHLSNMMIYARSEEINSYETSDYVRSGGHLLEATAKPNSHANEKDTAWWHGRQFYYIVSSISVSE